MDIFRALCLTLFAHGIDPCIVCWKDIAEYFDNDVTVLIQEHWGSPHVEDTVLKLRAVFLNQKNENKGIGYLDREQMEKETGSLFKELEREIQSIRTELQGMNGSTAMLQTLYKNYLEKLKSRSMELKKEVCSKCEKDIYEVVRCTDCKRATFKCKNCELCPGLASPAETPFFGILYIVLGCVLVGGIAVLAAYILVVLHNKRIIKIPHWGRKKVHKLQKNHGLNHPDRKAEATRSKGRADSKGRALSQGTVKRQQTAESEGTRKREEVVRDKELQKTRNT